EATDAFGGDNTILLDGVTIEQQPDSVADTGFETPVVADGDFLPAPADSPWTFLGSAGLAADGSGFTSGNPPAPQGNQVAYVQNPGTVQQSANLSGGTYVLSFAAAQRGNFNSGGQTFDVLVDGQSVGTFNNLTGATYQSLSTSSFTVGAGSHTVTF